MEISDKIFIEKKEEEGEEEEGVKYNDKIDDR